MESLVIPCVTKSSPQDSLSLLSFSSLSLLKSAQSGRKSNICSVAWHPAKNVAAFCDLTGHWGLVHEVRAETAAGGEAAKEDTKDMEASGTEHRGFACTKTPRRAVFYEKYFSTQKTFLTDPV